MRGNIDLASDDTSFTESDYNDMYYILEGDPDNFIYNSSDFIMDRLQDDFEYYYPYVERLYNYIKHRME